MKSSPPLARKEPAKASANHIPALTGIRAIAAFLVFFHHYPIQSLIIPGWDIQKEMHIGVTIFYVLSGFLITYRYYESAQISAKWLKRYFLNRFARIYPVYFLLLVPTLIIAGQDSIIKWILNITLLKGFFDGFHFSGIAQAWSLTVEECFYAFAPLVFLAHRRFRSLLIPLLFFGVLLLGLIGFGQSIDLYGLFGSPTFVLLYTFFGRFFEFFVGIQLALLLKKYGSASLVARIPFPTWLGSLGIFACLVGLSQLRIDGLAYGLYHPMGIAINNLLLPIFVAILFLGLIQKVSLLASSLGSSPFVILGKASYVFYLIHMGFIADWFHQLGIHQWWLIFLLMNGLAILLYKGFEHPVNLRIRKLIA